VLVQRALDSVHGVDLNPYAIAIARFRLLLAALKECGVRRLSDAPGFEIHLVCGDSLLHGAPGGDQATMGWATLDHVYQPEDREKLGRLLWVKTYHAVVANPPYITPKDRALNQAYRFRYESCHMKYSLAVPFLERIVSLAVEGGYTGQITANSFMKREFGQKLIEKYFPRVDLTHVIDTSGVYIPGHGTPTVIVFIRNRKQVASTLRSVMGIRGEPSTPEDPAKGLVWLAILAQIDEPGSQSDFVSVSDSERGLFHKHPWSIGGGGASELKGQIEERASTELAEEVEEIGVLGMTNADEVMLAPQEAFARKRVDSRAFKRLALGDQIRDWCVSGSDCSLFPYTNECLIDISEIQGVQRWMWPSRTVLGNRATFARLTYFQEGRPWWEWHQVALRRLRNPLSIVFASVATHNHFVLDRGGKVFKQSSPVIKLPANATEDEHLDLLGLLNSSTACFWMKQVFYPKATVTGDISTEKGKPEANRYDIAGTGLEKMPVPFEPGGHDSYRVREIAGELDRLSSVLAEHLPDAVIKTWHSSGKANSLRECLASGKRKHKTTRERMIALQEELDWELYRCFGFSPEGASELIIKDSDTGVTPAARPFAWEDEVGPESLPIAWRTVYSARREWIRSSSQLSLIEDAVFKRPWWGRQGVFGGRARDYEGWAKVAPRTPRILR
jgi:hypothetical protein